MNNKKKEFIVKLITAFSIILVLVIFGVTVYLLLSEEAGKDKNDVATLTDAIGAKLISVNYISTEATTEEITTEEVTTEQPTTEELIVVTTEATTEEITEEDTTYEEDYIYNDTYDSCYSGDEYNGYEEESYSEEPDDCYDEQSEEEYIEPNSEEPSEPNDMTYYGTMETTAYEWTGNPCADGRYPEEGYTVASNDPALWGHTIYIEGVGERYVHDTGGMGYSVVDIYMGDPGSCIEYGRQTHDIYIID